MLLNPSFWRKFLPLDVDNAPFKMSQHYSSAKSKWRSNLVFAQKRKVLPSVDIISDI